jgi:DNA-binding MarR family transcriptional regulator
MHRQKTATVRSALSGLRRLVRALRLSSVGAERQLGISAAQLFVLDALRRQPGMSLGELAALTWTDPSSVSVVVSRLVTRGLVVRRTAPDDARRAVLSATHRAEVLLRDGPEPVQRRLVESLLALEARELRTAAHVLNQIASALGVNEEAPMFFEERRRRARR